ncbi:RNA 3'-terminal phosphate cyclase [Gonapodya prolifera JEL478]|uniref:RNA 3'-terminal phosphate cyclase n=1 Tax=Gonapodya prolifera (strain JEL478) TaxID=1344416 RepID=A0A138ZZA4_GONPJ|nr:RNA 3'-terminal phosphate cyclase [Gonapodya prolifera JEL478]|eukprot:KXS09839.1 RNA 3'-terminal phosphate cyclase [Gonapodya prolifera JEL478]
MPKPRHSAKSKGQRSWSSNSAAQAAPLPGIAAYDGADNEENDGDRIDVDGGVLEGGGQILRSSMAYAAIRRVPIRVRDIRKNREKPGLRPQHMTGVSLVAGISNSRVAGVRVDSRELTFTPQTSGSSAGTTSTAAPFSQPSTNYTPELFSATETVSRTYACDTGTAGSVALLIQASLPVLLLQPGRTRLTLRGGTDVDHAPPIDYVTKVFQPVVHQKIGLNHASGNENVSFEVGLQRRGLYPRGGGEVVLDVRGVDQGRGWPGFELVDPGEVVKVIGYLWSSPGTPDSVLDEMETAARRVLRKNITFQQSEPAMTEEDGPTDRITFERTSHARDSCVGGIGAGLLLVAHTTTHCLLASSSHYSPSKRDPFSPARAGLRASNAATSLADQIRTGTCVDEYLQDQLIILMALAKGESRMRCGELTLHTQTGIYVAERMLPGVTFTVTEVDGRRGVWDVWCSGSPPI